MKSIFRIYAKTSKGNDTQLANELKAFGLSTKYDYHLNAFYFNSTFKNLFDISFRSMTIQQMYVQIGQKFRLIDEQQIVTELQKLPFKNYIPIQRGLVQNTTLKILVRESSPNIQSQNVLVNLFQTQLNKEIHKKEYYQNILGKQHNIDKNQNQDINFFGEQQEKKLIMHKKQRQRKNADSFFQIKDIVEKKWFQEDLMLEENNKKKTSQLEKKVSKLTQVKNNLLLKNDSQEVNNNQLIIKNEQTVSLQLRKTQKLLAQIMNFNKQKYLSEMLSYYPHLLFYIRKNKGRFLLKINKQDLYKHGWKSAVNYGPIRQSIAASVLHKSQILKVSNFENKKVRIWDPMCGSGTIPLVASTILDNLPVRNNKQDLFLWKKWPIFKQTYLEEYWKQIKENNKLSALNYQLILSDKDRQTINYSIDNFKTMIDKSKEFMNTQKFSNQLFPSKNIHSQILQLQSNKIGFACGDFQQVIKMLIPKNKQDEQKIQKLNIITNMPYLHGRSQQKYPLNQLKSLYKRFSEMIRDNKKYIDNVFILIDRHTSDWNHFINISEQKWNLISQYTSGGLQIGLYAWENNIIKAKFNDENDLSVLNQIQLTNQQRQLVLKNQKSVEKSLMQYRKKLGQIDRKYYNLPKYLMKDKKGWQRILQKRRRRHLQSAYQLFAKRRDKMIAFRQYARQKMQLKMLKKGTIWKMKNLKFFNNNNEQLQKYSQQISSLFEKRIQQALEKKQKHEELKKLKSGNKEQIVKIRNKWNNDQKYMIKQMKKSNSNLNSKLTENKNKNVPRKGKYQNKNQKTNLKRK